MSLSLTRMCFPSRDQVPSETSGVVLWHAHPSVSPHGLLQPLRELLHPCLGLTALWTSNPPPAVTLGYATWSQVQLPAAATLGPVAVLLNP